MTDNLSTALTDLVRTVAAFVPKFVAFLLILLIGWFIAKAIAKVVGKLLEKVGFDKAQTSSSRAEHSVEIHASASR